MSRGGATTGSDAPTLVVDQVVKSFDDKRAVNGVSLSADAGTIFGLLGRNGAGKTTTLRMVAGILFPDTGSVRVFGAPWSKQVRERLGYLPEERGLYRTMRVEEHIVYFGEIKGMSAEAARRAAAPLLERFGLGEYRARKVEELSKGNQQKVQLACVMVADPALLLLDEPMSGLDPVNVVLIREVLLELKARGKTVVLSTHLMPEAERLCDEVCIIHRGEVVLAGAPAKLRRSQGVNAVTVEIDDAPELEAEDLPGVERLARQGSCLALTTRAGADTNALIQALTARGRLRRFEVATPTLEEIFVAKVGERPADRAPEPEVTRA